MIQRIILKLTVTLETRKFFRNLVEEAHKRSIKIMLDAVFNHIGYQSAQWQDVLKNGENSPYKDWFQYSRVSSY